MDIMPLAFIKAIQQIAEALTSMATTMRHEEQRKSNEDRL